MKPRTLFLAAWLLALGACASGPRYDAKHYATHITPSQAVAEQATLRDSRVLWGGVIITSSNLKETTRLEILAYPLDREQRPALARPPLGRIIAQQGGYLETVDYAAGRSVTLTGRLAGVQEGRLGESAYTYPLIDIEQIYLWPKGGKGDSRVQFGFGVMIRN